MVGVLVCVAVWLLPQQGRSARHAARCYGVTVYVLLVGGLVFPEVEGTVGVLVCVAVWLSPQQGRSCWAACSRAAVGSLSMSCLWGGWCSQRLTK